MCNIGEYIPIALQVEDVKDFGRRDVQKGVEGYYLLPLIYKARVAT